jgi:glucan biosynthesis protein C
VCAAICRSWSRFAILEGKNRGKPRRLFTRLRLGILRATAKNAGAEKARGRYAASTIKQRGGKFMRTTSSLSTRNLRYYDLDWLRVFATFIVFVYHAAKPFNLDPWHIQNEQLSAGLDFWAGFLGAWIMPVFFVLSGMSIELSLRSRSSGKFVRERIKRLLIPLALGIFVLSPPQIYIERISYGEYEGSFLMFLPQYFNGLYLGYGSPGNFAWMGIHLWYLLLLFVYSILLLPLFLTLRGEATRTRLVQLGAWLEKPAALLLPAIPLMVLSAGLDPAGLGSRILGEWNVFIYLTLLVYGFVMMSSMSFEATVYRYRGLSFLVGLAAGLIASILDGALYGTVGFLVGHAARGLLAWCLIVFLFGLFRPLRDMNTPLLRYTSEMALPFYILHQPVIILLGYYLILPTKISPFSKYLLIVMICLPIVVVLYELLIRRLRALRILFGLKPRIHR